jgi:endoglucanase
MLRAILIGTPGWGSLGISDGRNETDVINNPVQATNIMYTFHFYAASHGEEYLGPLNRASNQSPSGHRVRHPEGLR